MQKDTRNVTVALDHLRVAHEEITTALGQAEASMGRAAAERAVRNLDLVLRRLEQEQHVAHERELAQAIERAFTRAQTAWQGAHDALNDWDRRHLLDGVRQNLLGAMEAIGDFCTSEENEEKLHA